MGRFLKPIFFFLFIAQFASAQYIEVDESYTAQQLVEDILINSPCANVSNFSVSGWQDFKSYSYFSRGNSTFPFEDGVLITTGKAVSAIGPNTTLLSEGYSSWGGDDDLEEAINENNTTNATVLEFDFLPIANKIKFEYIFSSEQYYAYDNPSQCNYSDGFAFLLREANAQNNYQNLAVVPNTNIPVKITTVRGEGTICPPANPQYFDAFNGAEHPTNYNGQTKILTAEAEVEPGTLYHIKLVIADQENEYYDSAIFLGGGSFSVQTDLGEDRLVATGNPLCEGASLELDATQDGTGNTYQWYRNGVALAGETNPTYVVTQEGTYRVDITLGNSGCTTSGEIIIEYVLPIPGENATLFQCVENTNDSGIYNLFDAASQIVQGVPSLNVESFHTTFDDAQNDTNTILNASNYTADDGEIVYARVSDNLGCTSVAEVLLRTTDGFFDMLELYTCSLPNATEFGVFDLSEAANQIYSLYGSDLEITFHLSVDNALVGVQNLPIAFTNTEPTWQTIYARLENENGCFGIVPMELLVVPAPQIDDDTTALLCLNDGDETLVLSSGVSGNLSNYEFLWSTGETTPTIEINSAGTYTVEVTQTQGIYGHIHTCTSTRTITVSVSSIAEVSYEASQNHGTQTITVITMGEGDYVYALGSPLGPYQESPVFEDVPIGVHSVYIKDLNGCGIALLNVYVLGFPNFFTPNNDGYHDYWQIVGWEQGNIRLENVLIFDRFGKIIHSLKLDSEGWDGTYKGNPLPSNDYWFKATFSDGSVYRNHFTLKR